MTDGELKKDYAAREKEPIGEAVKLEQKQIGKQKNI